MSSPAPLPPGAKAKLKVLKAHTRAGKTYGVKEGGITFIGRAGPQPVDLNLDEHEKPGNVFAQNRHANVIFQKGMLMISDQNTKSGTFVNRVKIPAGKVTPLKANDVINIGNVALQVAVVIKKKTGQQK